VSNTSWVLLAVGTLIASSAYGATNVACDDGLTASLRESARIVNSLHPDKAGQARVFASDGSEFTAGQAQWMKGQLRLITRACADGNTADASRRLSEVRKLLIKHRRSA
jgi:hypothetical protein